MTDVLQENPVSLASYQEFVQNERKPEVTLEGIAWNIDRARLIHIEASELMNQHGPGGALLVPEQYKQIFGDLTQLFPELKHDVSDELSDILWFCFDVAAHNNVDVGTASASSLTIRTGETHTAPESFETLQDSVMQNADNILFKIGSNSKEISIVASPLQTFAAALLNLTTALQEGIAEPVTEVNVPDSEKISLETAIGDFINVIVYVAKDRLDLDVNSLAKYNVFKLRQRKLYGKQAGNKFSEFFEHMLKSNVL